MAPQFLEDAANGLRQLLAVPLDPAQRLYWPFILSALALAFAATAYRTKKLSATSLRDVGFSLRYWWHRSSLTDLGYLLGNALLRATVLVPLLGSQLFVAIVVARFFQAQFGTPSPLHISPLGITAIYSVCFFLLDDFSRFVLHRAMHKIPLLWRFHKVHHSAHILTPLTLYRIHPVEMTLYYCRSMAVFGVMTGFFVFLFGSRVSAFDILGVHALGFLFNAMGANLRHSHVWLSFGKFEKWFISPAQHQIHHSRAAAHRDKNFGTVLALWDQLGQSIVYAERPRRLRFGLAKNANKPRAVVVKQGERNITPPLTAFDSSALKP